ncbi:MAG TPA: hypothetical protein VKE69_02270 [Planctomycetota bacterium]|nr:hypothetical protein [Planctomycetota bacterium]
MRFPLALPLVVPIVCLPGCVVAAVAVGAAAGVVVHETVIAEDTVEAEIARPADKVFAECVDGMREMSTEAVAIVSAQQRVSGKYDGADVVVEVRTRGGDHCLLRVKATKLEFAALDIARDVQRRLQERLQRAASSPKK